LHSLYFSWYCFQRVYVGVCQQTNIEPPALRRKAVIDKLVEKIVKHDSLPIKPDILSPALHRLTSR